MVSPPIQIFLTTIASQPALRQRQEYILRILQSKNITFSSYDLASDEEAKRLWRRKAPLDKQQLPGILVGGTCPGSFSDFEEAVEYGELETFLRLNETWDESINETRPTLPAKPIGVPGASSPSQMAKPAHKALFNASPASSPLRGGASPAANKESVRRRNESEFDVSDELTGYGLQGVKVTDDELLALVEELGLGGEEAGDLVKGLSDKADKREETTVREDGGSQQQQQRPGLEAEGSKAEAEVEVVREEAKASEGGGGVGNAETDVSTT
ncbi:hypothetical protein BJV78DRAFT_1116523 [Lactifluus subvellereus]|nr:hypothetical protein BJV78DRAFT_1116523 [Lactifluus subvellereus]